MSSDRPSIPDGPAIDTLGDEALGDVVASRREELLASIDRRIGRQIDEILHHPAFQAMERAYRGLWFVVERAASCEGVQIAMWSCTPAELERDFEDTVAQEDSALFELVHASAHESGETLPYTAIVADFQVEASPAGAFLLMKCASIAHRALCPFVVGAPLALFEADRSRRAQPHDFRTSQAAHGAVLALPRFLLRAPHESRTEGFVHHESASHEEGVWAPASLAVAAHLIEGFARDRWAHAGAGGASLEGLPVSAGGVSLEFEVSESLGRELVEHGYSPLVSSGAGRARFLAATVLHRPRRSPGTEAAREVPREVELPDCLVGTRALQRLRIARQSLSGRSTVGGVGQQAGTARANAPHLAAGAPDTLFARLCDYVCPHDPQWRRRVRPATGEELARYARLSGLEGGLDALPEAYLVLARAMGGDAGGLFGGVLVDTSVARILRLYEAFRTSEEDAIEPRLPVVGVRVVGDQISLDLRSPSSDPAVVDTSLGEWCELRSRSWEAFVMQAAALHVEPRRLPLARWYSRAARRRTSAPGPARAAIEAFCSSFGLIEAWPSDARHRIFLSPEASLFAEHFADGALLFHAFAAHEPFVRRAEELATMLEVTTRGTARVIDGRLQNGS